MPHHDRNRAAAPRCAPKTQASVRTIGVADFVLDAVAGRSVLHRVSGIAARKVDTRATPHDPRHYFAGIQIAGGCSIKNLQQMLGHKSATETWDTYGHLIGDEDDHSRAVIQRALGAPLQGLLKPRDVGG